MSDETTSVWSDIWDWVKWLGELFPALIEAAPVFTAWAWPASLLAVWWFM